MRPQRLILFSALFAHPLAMGCSVTPEPEAAPIAGQRADRAHQLASRAYRHEDPSAAMALYVRSIDELSSYAAAWNNLGVLLMEQNRNLEADEAFEVASRSDLNDPRPTYNRGLLYHQLGHFQEARQYYAETLDRDPSYAPALLGHIQCEVYERIATEETLERIDTALQLVNDEEDLQSLKIQRLNIEHSLHGSVSTNEIR